MKKLLPIILATTVYLTTMYPVYAQPTDSEGELPPPPPLQRSGLSAQGSSQGSTQKLPPLKNATGAANLKPGGPAMERMEKNATMSAAFKQKLARFKNKNKAQRLELINTNLNEINNRRTGNMQQILDKISEIVERLKNKASTASSSEIDAAISDVETQWAAASAAVEAQAAKDYSINLNTETTAASDAAAAKNALQSDLQATHTQVIQVKQSLSNAISTVMSSLGGNNGSN